MHLFNEWVENYFIPNFNKRTKRKGNLGYYKKYNQNELKVKDKSIRLILSIDFSFRRMYYF